MELTQTFEPSENGGTQAKTITPIAEQEIRLEELKQEIEIVEAIYEGEPTLKEFIKVTVQDALIRLKFVNDTFGHLLLIRKMDTERLIAIKKQKDDKQNTPTINL